MNSFESRLLNLNRIFFSVAIAIIAVFWSGVVTVEEGNLLAWAIGSILPDLAGNHQVIVRGMITSDSGMLLWNLASDPLFRYFILACTLGICTWFLKGALSAKKCFLLYLMMLIMSSSSGGRRISFDFYGYVILGFGLGCLLWNLIHTRIAHLVKFERFVLLSGLSGLYATYTASGIAKLVVTGLSWANSTKIPIFLRFQQYHYSVGESAFDITSYLPDFLFQPSLMSTASSAFVLIIEVVAIAAPLFGRYRSLISIGLLFVHLGIGVTAGLWVLPIWITLYLLGLPWIFQWNEKRTAGLLKGEALTILPGLVLLLLTFGLPKEPLSDRRLMYPFCTFSMFNDVENDFVAYYFQDKNQQRVPIQKIIPNSKTNVLMLNVILTWEEKYAENLMCRYFRSNGLSSMNEFTFWKHAEHIDPETGNISSYDKNIPLDWCFRRFH